MSLSGVEVTPECKTIMENVRLRKTLKYVIFKVEKGKIIIEKEGPKGSKYEEFLTDLKQKDGEHEDCRYAIYDFHFTIDTQGTEPSQRSKIFLCLWCPESAKVKSKMVYSSSFDALKKIMKADRNIQANDDDEIEESTVNQIFITASRT